MSVSNAPVALASASFTDFPNAEIVTGGTGISVVPGGSQGNLTISVTGQLTSLANLAATGFVVFNDSTNTYTARTINSGSGISVTRGDGLSGNCVIAQTPATVVQRVYVTGPLGTPGSFPNIEFIAGDGISVAVADAGLGAKAQVTITNTHGSEGSVDSVDAASTTGLLITGTPGLPITESGTINIDLPGSGASSAVVQGDMLVGNTGGSYTVVGIGTTGKLWTSNGTTASWLSPATSGTVTSVGISSATGLVVGSSPVTTSGTMTVNLPGTGASSAVVQGDMLIGSTGGSYTTVAIGTTGKLWTSDGTTASWQSPATSGTVTSVGVSSTTGLIVGSSPVTTSGTMTVDLPGSGGSSAIVKGDLLVGSSGGGAYTSLPIGAAGKVLVVSGGTPFWGGVSISAGGTGMTTANAGFAALSPMNAPGDLIYMSGLGVPDRLALGSSNTFLRSTGAAPAWSSLYSLVNLTTGTVSNFATTQVVSTTAVTASSVITLTITGVTGSPTIAPAVYVGTIIGGVSFQIVPIGVGGGGGKASTISVTWAVA